VRVRVTLSGKLNADSVASLPLFVFVRDPRAAGPPLAVKRLKATFPQTVELTTQDSMLPGHSFTKGQLVEIVARVSKSGGPVESAGDLFGLAAHKVGEGGVVDIQVEHVSP
jgi:cytochrome c-type biogenesis protein CcmH